MKQALHILRQLPIAIWEVVVPWLDAAERLTLASEQSAEFVARLFANSKSFLSRLLKLNRLQGKIADQASSLGEWAESRCDDLEGVSARPSWLVVDAFYSLFEFIGVWVASRRRVTLLGATPALLLLSGVSAVWLLCHSGLGETPRLIQQYRQRMTHAQEVGNKKLETLCAKKLEQLGANRPIDRFLRNARSYSQTGGQEEVAAISELADQHFGPANLWLAREMLSERIPSDDQEIDRRLRQALELMPHNVLAHDTRVEWLASRLSNDEARPVLRQIDVEQLSVNALSRLMLKQIELELPVEVRDTSSRILSILEALPKLTVAQTLIKANAQSALGRNLDAISTLSSGFDKHQDDRLRRRYFMLAKALLNHRGPNVRETWKLYANACLQSELANEEVQCLIASSLTSTELRDLAEQMLSKLINDQIAYRRAVALAADICLQRQDWRLTVYYNEFLLDRDARDFKAANNLALGLSKLTPPNLQKALEAANHALTIAPNDPAIHETRGQLYRQMGMCREAVLDLSLAANGLGDYWPIHDALADCYQQLGEAELSKAHRNRANSLTAGIRVYK